MVKPIAAARVDASAADHDLDQLDLSDAVAVVGVGLRAPSAADPEQLWQTLSNGRDQVTRFSFEQREHASYRPTSDSRTGWVGAAGMLEEPLVFDAEFFGYGRVEAACMDPQQRVLLEVAHEALERSGHHSQSFDGNIGVFVGCGAPSYLLHLAQAPQTTELLGSHQVLLGTDKDFLATRIAYHLGLNGPSVSVQTACSTSLVAIHTACASLLAGESDLALAGGVSIQLPQRAGYTDVPGSIFSPTGVCRPYDREADGTVPGNGAAIVVLKRWQDAERDGDTVLALVRGTAVNNDGAQRAGFTAPSVSGQAAVLAEALSVAGVTPQQVSYIEGHGTGTRIGDPIELSAIQRVYGERASDAPPCALGSLKGNFGHMDAAAGVFGFIKVCLMLQARTLVPTPNVRESTQTLASDPRFYVETETRPWVSADGECRHAAVSSFGLGGTNAHAVLMEAPSSTPNASASPPAPVVLTVSAQTMEAASRRALDLASALERAPALRDVAHTLAVGRETMPHRIAIVAKGCSAARDALIKAASEPTAAAGTEALFVFPGQGVQHERMAQKLYESDPEFRQSIDRCAEASREALPADLRAVIGCMDAGASGVPLDLTRTDLAQPAIFAVSYAYAQRLRKAGIRPAGMVGHSLGEWVAATVGGVFGVEDAIRLVCERGRIMQAMAPGAMASVMATPKEVSGQLKRMGAAAIEIAAINGAEATVVAGPRPALEGAVDRLRAEGWVVKLLRTSHAFHTQAMEPAAQAFAAKVAQVQRGSLQIPFYSTVTGKRATAQELAEPSYWANQLRQPVRFDAAYRAAVGNHKAAVVDVGPGRFAPTLDGHEPVALAPRAGAGGSSAMLDRALAELWTRLDGVDLGHLRPRGRRIPLPVYPFAGDRHVVEVAARSSASDSSVAPPAETSSLPRGDRNPDRFIEELWTRLLGQPPENDEADFFASGGHSLLATRFVSRVRQELDVALSLRKVFEMPTLGALKQAVREQQTLIEASDASLQTPIDPRPEQMSGPLTSAQEGVWFMQRLNLADPSYNVCAAIRLRGRLDVEAMTGAWRRLIAEHEALRTRFVEIDGQPRQRIVELDAEVGVELEYYLHSTNDAVSTNSANSTNAGDSTNGAMSANGVDFTSAADSSKAGEPHDGSEAWIASRAREEGAKPFDLERPPLARLKVLAVGQEHWVLLMTVHHIVSDGGSVRRIARDLSRWYGELLAGHAPAEELGHGDLGDGNRLRFLDCALHEERYLRSAEADRSARYWTEQLKGAQPVPLHPCRQGVAAGTGGRVSRHWDRTVADSLAALGRQSRGTIHTSLTAIAAVVTRAFSGETDVVLGADVANRPSCEVEDIVGFFVNQVVLRVGVHDGDTFSSLVGQVHRTTLDAFDHQAYPFAQVVSLLAPERGARSPLFHAKVILHRDPSASLAFAELRAEALDVYNRTAKFDLAMNFIEGAKGLTLQLEYSHQYYSDDRATRLADQLRLVTECAIADPGVSIGQLVSQVRQHELRASRTAVAAAKPSFSGFRQRSSKASYSS